MLWLITRFMRYLQERQLRKNLKHKVYREKES